MLEELLKELNELRAYKSLYETAIKEKERMSALLYEYMIREYNRMSYTERAAEFKKETCCSCRYRDNCHSDLPLDIMRPVQSEDAWIPGTIGCRDFRWG